MRRYLIKKKKRRWILILKAVKCYRATVPVLLKCTDMFSALLRRAANLSQSNEKLVIKVITCDSFENVNQDHPACSV